MYKKIVALGLSAFLFGTFLSVPFWANAQLDSNAVGLDYGTESGLSSTDPREIAARIINVSLGLLGTITLVLIIYGGFLWMTAAGNDDQVGKAKQIMIAGIIGLAIVLAAYGIATYVVNSLLTATA